MITGLSLLLYPTVANWWNSFHSSRAVANYSNIVESLDTSTYEMMLSEAEKYNEDLLTEYDRFTNADPDDERYNSLLNITGDGMMGHIEIPSINVSLPIYHGTSEAVLGIGVGHIQGTSLPTGGDSTNCVLSGHRGLPSAKLFTDLDKMVEGDKFMIYTLNETFTYEVDRIRIVEPQDIAELAIVEGEDICTLVTCTPYGVNTHRLLVIGHRVENAKGDVVVTSDAMQIEPIIVAPIVAAPILILLFIMLLVTSRKKKSVKIEKGKKSSGSEDKADTEQASADEINGKEINDGTDTENNESDNTAQ